MTLYQSQPLDPESDSLTTLNSYLAHCQPFRQRRRAPCRRSEVTHSMIVSPQYSVLEHRVRHQPETKERYLWVPKKTSRLVRRGAQRIQAGASKRKANGSGGGRLGVRSDHPQNLLQQVQQSRSLTRLPLCNLINASSVIPSVSTVGEASLR